MRFRILGSLEADAAGRAIPLGSPQQRAVLALLLVRANELVPSDAVVDELWGDEPPDAARSTIYSYVSHLRKLIGAERILSQAPGYRLMLDPQGLDAARFERLLKDASKARTIDPRLAATVLDEALGLWRGDALSDVAEGGSLSAEATRLDELRMVAAEERIDALLAIGEHARAIGDAEILVDRHPLRERIWRQLMLALYRDGRQADALNAFHRVREVLADELGIDPSPQLTRLHEQILQQDPGLELRGEPLRGYRLLEKIGEGRSGAVFRSLQPRVGRDVAVKIFHEQLAAETSFARRFEQEAQAVAALEHPHIVPVYDYWREPGHACLVWRYMKGGSLGALRARGELLDPDRALVIFEQIAGALAFAHRQRIAHGTIRASNVLLDGEGNAYLGDFRVGIGLPADPADDVRGLAALGRDLLDGQTPPRLAELLERAQLGNHPPDADAFVEATRPSTVPPLATLAASVGPRNPYKGLRAFTEADSPDFFGRSELTARLLGRLAGTGDGSRFLAVVGPSGSGKSSLVRAGLVPAIRAGGLGDPQGIFVVDMFPGAHPLEELEASLLRGATRSVSQLRELLEQGSRGLLEAAGLLLPPAAELVLVVDQFEEVFTLARDERERALFLESLRVAAADPDSRIRVVITLRADFYDRPLVYPRFGELFARATSVVPPLTPDELEQAIRRPAEGVGVAADRGLVAEIIADISDQPGALPLLQYALTELFERREDDLITLDAYRTLGGVAGALSVRADRIYEGLDRDGRRAARQIFLRLVHLGEGRRDTRRRVARSELDELDVDPRVADPMLDAYGRHRLLTFDREPASREPTVEIAHEALLTAWVRLRTWIDDARDDLRQDLRLTQAAGEWRASDRDPSFLLRGARLEQVETWASSTDLAIGRPERAYLKASEDRRSAELEEERVRLAREERSERRSRSRLRALVAVLSVAALVAAGLTAIATDQSRRAAREAARAEREATVATARELAAAAVANVDDDPERSILLAMEAVELTRALDGSVLPEAEDALHRALAQSRVVMTVQGVGGPVAWGPNGLFAAAGTPGSGIVEVRNDRTGDVVRTIQAHDGAITGVAFAYDGMTLATTGTDGALKVWDPATGGLLVERAYRGPAMGVSASRSGSFAAAWPDDRVVRIFDPTSGRVRTLEVPGVPSVVALDPEASRIAVTVSDRRTSGSLVLDARSGERVVRWRAHGALSWSPDGGSIATTTTDPSVDVFDVELGEHLPRDGGGHDGVATALAWSPTSSHLVSGGVDGEVKVWDVFPDGFEEALSLSSAETLAGIGGIAVAPDGTRVMVGAEDGTTVKIFDVSFEGDAEWANMPTHALLGDLEFLPDGRLVASNDDNTATIWDAKEGQPLATIGSPGGNWLSYNGEAAVSPDGRSVASAEWGGGVEVWELEGNVLLFAHHGRPKVADVDWSPDGEHLVMSTRDGRALVVDRTGAEIQILQDEEYKIRLARFSPDGTVIATSGSGPSGESVRLWDRARGRVIGEFPASAYRLVFDPSGTRIATVPPELGRPEVWDVSTGERLVILAGSSGQVHDVAFSPDGSRVATASFDRTGVRMFDAETGALLFTLPGLDGGPYRLDFSPDGSSLASIGKAEIKVWALDIGDLLEIARREVTRPLTDEECRQYLHVDACPA